jgi:hypothetical protein
LARSADRKAPHPLGTWDAAYGEAGRFQEAIKTAPKTRVPTLAAGERENAKAAQERVTLYEFGKPYRQQ